MTNRAGHDPESCPACQVERETGETAPVLAHGWQAPTQQDLERNRALIDRIVAEAKESVTPRQREIIRNLTTTTRKKKKS
jgi:hypothetical protein